MVYRTSETMTPLHPRIEAFVRRDASALAKYVDIPTSTYTALWAADAAVAAGGTVSPSSDGQPGRTAEEPGLPQTVPTRAKATRAPPKGKGKPGSELSPSDIRSPEWRQKQLAGMRAASGLSSQ